MHDRKRQKNQIWAACLCALLSLLLLSSCAKSDQAQQPEASDPLHLVEYAAYIGLPRAQALEALGLADEDLELLDELNNADLYRVKGRGVTLGGSEFDMILRFEGSLTEPESGEYLYYVNYRLQIDGQTEEELFYAVAALQDAVMKACGRPHTYWLEGGLSTEIILPGMLNPEQEFAYIDRWLVAEEGSYPGDESEGGSVIMAALDIRNNELETSSPLWRHIQLQLTFRTVDSLMGPKVDGEAMYDFIYL